MKKLLILLISLYISNTQAATTIFSSGFEPGHKGLICSGNCPSKTSHHKKTGKYASNFILTRNMKTSYRTEAVFGERGRFAFGKEYLVSFDYRYEDWKKDRSKEFAPFQIHTTQSNWKKECKVTRAAAGSAPFFMTSGDDKVRFATYKNKTLWSGSIQKRKWLKMVVHFKISTGNDGFIEAWKDGVKLGRVNGANSPKFDGCGNLMKAPYLKLGIYKWDWKKGRKATGSTRRQLLIDNINISTGKSKTTIKSKKHKNKTSSKKPRKKTNKKLSKKQRKKITKLIIKKKKSKKHAKKQTKSIKYTNEKNLIAYWPSSNAFGKTLPDASGNGNTGFINKASITKGGINYNGINSYTDVGRLNIKGKAMTISGWFNAKNLKNCKHSDCRIISKASGVKDNKHNWMISTINVGSKIRLRFRLKTGRKVTTLVASAGNLKNGKWVHFAAVYNGRNMSLYKDGKLVGITRKGGNIALSKAKVWIGGSPVKSTLRPWKGRIDEVRIYNSALSKKQIAKLANE